jgi:AraC-like DNA-binding protein
MAPPAPVQRTYGLSLAGYIRAQKLQKSVERLTHSDEPILNVAIALGFDSQQSFNRSFKRQYGQAPAHGGAVWVAGNAAGAHVMHILLQLFPLLLYCI